MPDQDLLDILQKRMDDPTYHPTGPTYGEVVLALTEEEIRERIAKVNWMRAMAEERERCAQIAEEAARVIGADSGSSIHSACQLIAKRIREGV